MIRLKTGDDLSFVYTNHHGETSARRAQYLNVEYGANDWYPEKQLFLRCWDYDKLAERSFAVAKIDADSLTLA